MIDLFVLALVFVAFIAGVAVAVRDVWMQAREWRARHASRVPTPARSLMREPWQETAELGSGRHLRLDYSDIKIEEDEP